MEIDAFRVGLLYLYRCLPARRVCSLRVLLTFVIALTANSVHASWGENFGSVHFNSGEPDFGTPPRRTAPYNQDSRPGSGGSATSGGPIYTELEEGDFQARLEKQAKQRAVLQAEWEQLLARERWAQARTQIRHEAKLLGWTGSLRDRDEILTEVLKQPQPVSPLMVRRLRTYFFGIRLAGDVATRNDEARLVFQRLFQDSKVGFLREHALYQLASLYYQEKECSEAIRLYQRLCREFPHSVKKPAALLMIARSALLRDADRLGWEADWPKAKNALDHLRQEFPRSHFTKVAQGLYGRYFYLTGNYLKAASIYLALNDIPSLFKIRPYLSSSEREQLSPHLLAAFLYRMERADNYTVYVAAHQGVEQEMQVLTPTGAMVFLNRLLHEPSLAAPYFYYRLYYTDYFRDDRFYENAFATPEETAAAKVRRDTSRRNLLRLASRIAHFNDERLPLQVRLRLAEVYYQEHQYPQALRWAGSVLRRGERTGVYDRALYVRGATYQKQRRHRAAIADFERLLDSSPNSPLRPAAREMLAILYEAVGNNGAALDQYFYLKYDQDVAYLLDVRMTTRQVATYRGLHPHHPQRALLTYSLGVRYLRDDNLSAARLMFNRLTPKQYAKLSHPETKWGDQFDSESPDPRKVIDTLVLLRQNIRVAKTNEARATAMYRHASYHYQNGLLLFYNAALWKGERVFNFDVFWNRKQMTPADRKAIRRHMYEHEVYVRVVKLCRDIANRYPKTTVAPLALYRAACATDHLYDLNQWWGDENNWRRGGDESAALMRRLARRYPKHPLAHNARKYAAVFSGANLSKEEKEEMKRQSQETSRAY